MGDHRADIKIEFHMHGKTEKADMWINWTPADEYEGVDRRIVEWFAAMANAAYARFDEEQYEADRERRERVEKETELAELARLKAKYEAGHAADGL